MRTDNSKVIADLIEENERLKEAIERQNIAIVRHLGNQTKYEDRIRELEKLIQYLNGKVPAEIIPSIHRNHPPTYSEGEE
jgi:hypothetical protein